MTRRQQIAIGFAVLVVLLMVFGAIRYDKYDIVSSSMQPTLAPGDEVFARVGATPRVNDVIVFDRPESVDGASGQLIARLIAIEDQQISFRDGRVFLDGVRIEEPFLAQPNATAADLAMPGCVEQPAVDECTVPPGHVFVMGDNRSRSSDSRTYGPIDLDSVRGVVVDAPFWYRIDLLPG